MYFFHSKMQVKIDQQKLTYLTQNLYRYISTYVGPFLLLFWDGWIILMNIKYYCFVINNKHDSNL